MLIRLLLALICVAVIQNGNADDEFASCIFKYPSSKFERSFNSLSMIFKLKGAENPKGLLFESLCDLRGNSVFEFVDQPKKNGQYDPLPENESGLHVAKISVDGCVFDQLFGINGDRFVIRSNYSELCKTTTSSKSPYEIYRKDGKWFYGYCANGKNFTGQFDSGSYNVSGPSGPGVNTSMDVAIKQSCGQ